MRGGGEDGECAPFLDGQTVLIGLEDRFPFGTSRIIGGIFRALWYGVEPSHYTKVGGRIRCVWV